MGDTILVFSSTQTSDRLPCPAAPITKPSSVTFQRGKSSPTIPQAKNDCSSLIGRSIENKGISAEVKSIIIDSWRNSTRSRYEITLRRWETFCIQRNSDPFLSFEFLNDLYNSGCQYSALCTARSALASVVTIQGFPSLSDHPMIHRYLKGMYNRNPPMPKYIQVRDLNVILNFLNKAPPYNALSFKQLTLKVAMLLMILGARRKQSVMSIEIIDYQSDENKAILLPNK